MTSELAIIIINWNGGELLKRCLDSIEQFPPSVAYEIVVVDNDSTDGSREWLETQSVQSPKSKVTLIKNNANVGFGQANNVAFRATTQPLLFLLNSDAKVTAGSIDTLIETIKSNPKFGVVGPRLHNPDGTLQASVWRNPPSSFETLANAFRLYKLMPKRMRGDLLLGYHWDHSHRRSAALLSGAALLVRRAVIDDVGGFEERFHMYGEDTEWCLRIVRGGWLMIFEPPAIVVHYGGASATKRWTDLEKRREVYLSFFRFQKLSLSRSQVITNLLSGCLASSAQLLWRFLRRQPRDEARMVVGLHMSELKRVLLSR
ncbi:MAG TPA: glycosyltransferase family 2 protein [Pyrinomonadaceae bacterium]